MSRRLTTIYVVRHGETEWNEKGLLQGHTDSPLTNKGLKQGRGLAEKLIDVKFDVIFSSDLLRAKRTAEIIALERKLAVQATKALREQSFGKYEGSNKADFYKSFEIWAELSEEEKHKYKKDDDVESNEETVSRLITFLREVAVAYRGKTILVVSHGAIMRYLAIHLGYFKYKDNLVFNNSGYLKLETDGIDFFIKKIQGIQKIKR